MKATMKMLSLATAVIALASCTSAGDVYNPDNAIEKKQAEYEKAFVQTFGKIAPNQDWGFGTASSTKAETRSGASPNLNMWWKTLEVPAPLSDAQIKVVTDWFTNTHNPQGIAVYWSDFFVQQVNSSEYGKSNTDYLFCGTSHHHIDRFNGGDYNNGTPDNVYEYDGDPNNSNKYHQDKIMLMVDSGTECFGYKETKGSDSDRDYDDKYVIIPGNMIDPSVAGMYFVGLDYQRKGNGDVSADGYYNDWIVRITPAKYTSARRIMAEDLGSIGDFDFNDVVFDAYIDGNQAVVTLRAAGGTLPLYVGDKEVHTVFGVSTSTIVNTEKGKHQEKEIIIYRVNLSASSPKYSDIPIKVDQGDGTQLVELKAEVGKAPRKICVQELVDWSNEWEAITTTYPNFASYVNDPTICWWKQYNWQE